MLSENILKSQDGGKLYNYCLFSGLLYSVHIKFCEYLIKRELPLKYFGYQLWADRYLGFRIPHLIFVLNFVRRITFWSSTAILFKILKITS